MPQTIYPLDILTSSGRYPEREKDGRCSSAIRINAGILSDSVSKLLDHLGFKTTVSSGLRYPETLANDAAKSAHFTGEACDLWDPQGKIAQAILADPSILEKYDLYMESPQHTNGWIHLSTRRTKSGNRIFLP